MPEFTPIFTPPSATTPRRAGVPLGRVLALDSSSDRVSVAYGDDQGLWSWAGEGAARSSRDLLPAVAAVLAAAHTRLSELDAVAFGAGPGAFTGLRTACSVAQGLALGANKPVIPVSTLHQVAQWVVQAGGAGPDSTPSPDDAPLHVWALIDARMGEIYAQALQQIGPAAWREITPPQLISAAQAPALLQAHPGPWVWAGSALGCGVDTAGETRRLAPEAVPQAQAVWALAQGPWWAGEALDAAWALPLYVRNKVALTTEEREQAAAQKRRLEASA